MNRRALLVGLNHYPDPENDLKGCVNDVLQVSRLLQTGLGFDDAAQIRLLIDERATTTNIKDRLRWLLDGTGPGDLLVFHYSGHGSQVRDRDGDELDDGLDEIICPYDLDWDHPFTDDDLRECLQDLQPGVNLTVVLDCCHSGTGLREAAPGAALPSRWKYLEAPVDIRHRVGPCITDLGPGRRLSMTRARVDLPLRRFGRSAAEAGAILLAGCQADQMSADAWIEGDYHGAFTYFLCAAMEEARCRITYGDLLQRTRQLLASNRYDQLPDLEGPSRAAALLAFCPVTEAATAA